MASENQCEMTWRTRLFHLSTPTCPLGGGQVRKWHLPGVTHLSTSTCALRGVDGSKAQVSDVSTCPVPYGDVVGAPPWTGGHHPVKAWGEKHPHNRDSAVTYPAEISTGPAEAWDGGLA